MPKIDLNNLTIRKAHEAMKRGDFSAVDLAQAYLDVIAKKNKDLNAYLEVFDDVIEQAKAADKIFASARVAKAKMATGMVTGTVAGTTTGLVELTGLTGIPLAIKDNILIKGRIASSASKMLEHYRATYDATAIEKLKKAGVVFLGRTNMDEFALGSSTEKSAFGVTKNPHDTSRVPGGTSGGSAAVVASGMALGALGSDTGGSIRQPSAFCGVVGLKPTYGAVSRSGLMAAVSSFDQIGPITKNVSDAEIIFNTIRGRDPLDGTTIDENTYHDTYRANQVGAKKPVIGIPQEFLKQGGIHKDILSAVTDSIEKFKKLGYEIKDIDLPNAQYCLPVYYILNFAEVSSNLSRFDGVRYGFHKDGVTGIDDYFESRGAGFDKETRRRILLGTYVLSSGYYDAYYNRANAVRRVITADFNTAFEKVDIIMTPTTPTPAWKIGEKSNDPVAMYLEDIFTVSANLTGLPAMSVPAGFAKMPDSASLPVGIQLTARNGGEEMLFYAGKDLLGEK
jgi:aspartyl-tRNA(Asn)/glutamyl-tRNA(Gln) amidotransferase subunit A